MSTESNWTKDEAQIRTLRNNLANAVCTKSVDGVMSHYVANPVMFELAPPLQIRGDERTGRQNLEQWFATFRGPIGYEIRDLHITVDHEVAFCHSLNRISGMRSNGDQTDIWVRETLCFRKIDNEWKIVHEHQSVPLYMDGSNKAAVDLKPRD